MNPLQLLPDLSIAGFIITMTVENLIGVHGICEMFWETTVLLHKSESESHVHGVFEPPRRR